MPSIYSLLVVLWIWLGKEVLGNKNQVPYIEAKIYAIRFSTHDTFPTGMIPINIIILQHLQLQSILGYPTLGIRYNIPTSSKYQPKSLPKNLVVVLSGQLHMTSMEA